MYKEFNSLKQEMEYLLDIFMLNKLVDIEKLNVKFLLKVPLLRDRDRKGPYLVLH